MKLIDAIVKEITVRASALPSHQQCSRRSAAILLFREFADEFGLTPRERHIGAVVGTGSHAGVAHVMHEFRQSGMLPGIKSGAMSTAIDVAIESVRADTLDGFVTDPVTPTKEDAEFQVRQIVLTYSQHVDPQAVPILVERGLKMSVGDGLIITGHMDRVDALTIVKGQPRDLKTGRHVPQAGAQYGCYSLLIRANAGLVAELEGVELSGSFAEDYMPRVPRGKLQPPPRVKLYPQGILEREALATARRMERELRAFRETGDPEVFPNNPTSWLCSRKLCPAWRSGWCAAGFLKPEKDDES